jgi:hypothetical protein
MILKNNNHHRKINFLVLNDVDNIKKKNLI